VTVTEMPSAPFGLAALGSAPFTPLPETVADPEPNRPAPHRSQRKKHKLDPSAPP
jgi:hypothetical protein